MPQLHQYDINSLYCVVKKCNQQKRIFQTIKHLKLDTQTTTGLVVQSKSNHWAMFGFKGHNHLAMFGFRISIQYPSGSVMNARPFILPADRRTKQEFHKAAEFSSKYKD